MQRGNPMPPDDESHLELEAYLQRVGAWKATHVMSNYGEETWDAAWQAAMSTRMGGLIELHQRVNVNQCDKPGCLVYHEPKWEWRPVKQVTHPPRTRGDGDGHCQIKGKGLKEG